MLKLDVEVQITCWFVTEKHWDVEELKCSILCRMYFLRELAFSSLSSFSLLSEIVLLYCSLHNINHATCMTYDSEEFSQHRLHNLAGKASGS